MNLTAESRYHSFELEMLAIVKAIEDFIFIYMAYGSQLLLTAMH